MKTSAQVNRALPTKQAENAVVTKRLGSYAEQYVIPLIGKGAYPMSDEGEYFKAFNPTPGTGIAMGIQTTFSETAQVLMALYNGDAAKRVYLDFIRLICTAAGGSTTQSDIVAAIDSGANRYNSGGTDLTIANSNMDSATATIVTTKRLGIVSANAASGNRRFAGRATVKVQASPCWVAGDELFLDFGAENKAIGLLSGSNPSRFVIPMGPVIFGPAHSFLLHMWNTANSATAPSWEVEAGWWER